MASRAIKGGASAPPAVPLDVLLSAIPGLPRAILNRLVERAIEHLDTIDGDPDLEDGAEAERTGDEGEPDFRKAPKSQRRLYGPGCIISDPDHGADDEGEMEDCR